MKTFKSKPTFLDAIQWDGTEESVIKISKMDMVRCRLEYSNGELTKFIIIDYCDVANNVIKGSYIIFNLLGPAQVIKKESFEQRYEEVKE